MGLIRTFARILCTIAALAWLASCAGPARYIPSPAPDKPGKPGDLFDAAGQPLSYRSFADLAAGYDYVLIGEGHSNRCDHVTQARLLASMAAFGEPPAVGLEMVAKDREVALEMFNRGELTSGDLPGEIDWKKTWGYDYSLYEPLFKVAEKNSLPVAALNLPFSVVRSVSDKGLGGLSEDEKAYLPEQIIPPVQEQMDVLEESFAMHPQDDGEDEDERLERFYLIQSLWDSKMAEEAMKARKRLERPVAVIAGSGHVEYGWGIKHRLDVIDPASKTLTVVPWRGDAGGFEGGDVLFFCPASHRSSLGMTLAVENGRVKVTDVAEGSRAEKAGLLPGDVILRAADAKVEGLMDLHKAGMKARKDNVPLVFEVERGGEVLNIEFPMSGKE